MLLKVLNRKFKTKSVLSYALFTILAAAPLLGGYIKNESSIPPEAKQLIEQVGEKVKSYKDCKIVFNSDRDGDPEIYVMSPDGAQQRKLTNNSANDLSPCWSLDGGKIAFFSDRDGNNEIYIMNADGTGQKNLTNNPANDRGHTWSPDGGKIAFFSDRGGNNEIYIMNADGTGQKNLTNNPGGDGFPSWSPSGKQIAFISTRDGNEEIYVMNADGTEQERLTINSAYEGPPCWSPNGEKMIFSSKRDGNAEIYIMNANGGYQKRLTNSPSRDRFPCWSSDGERIIFHSGVRRTCDNDVCVDISDNYEIYIMKTDGTELKNLTNNPACDSIPLTNNSISCWSPDGRKITFFSNRDGNFDIYIMSADGTGLKNLTNSSDDNYGCSWSPFLRSEAR